MSCLICNKDSKNKLCNKCSKVYLFDRKYNFIRKKKYNISFFSISKNSVAESRLYLLLCNIYDKINVFRNVHPLWAISNKGVLLEYDVAIPSKKLLIEYDGKQHFVFPNFYHKTRREFLAQKSRDKLKNRLAKKNSWKLIRFNYTDKIDEINIERKLKTC